jgi:hypothetical protein
MPVCHRPTKREEREDMYAWWREPPGYLGEAVRRAKQIGRVTQPQPREQSQS